MASVAVVGIAVELPSGAFSERNLDYQSFFQFLLEGKVAYEGIPPDRFNIDAWYGKHPGQIQATKGAFLKHIDVFDNVEFGVSSKDALSMAPVTRKLLENSFLALLDSGIDYRMRNVGCFTSGNVVDLMNVSEPDEYDARGSVAGLPSMVANRISMHLDLLGPSVPIDTACSSTLTAFHLAVQSVSHGECEAAVVAGCQLNHRFMDWFTYSQASLLAKDGMCKPFDASADGFSRGEGCVAIVIKPMAHALRDHDRIYAKILGTAINSSGGSAPPGAPVAEAQRNAMCEAFKRAGRHPRDVDYVELHATGTAKGDPTEANWVGADFCRDHELLIGSTKGNIGHTEIVAFLASLAKVLSMLQSKVIPPAVNIRDLNPEIEWKKYQLRAPLHPTPLPCRTGGKPLIAMAGSGIGGSNGHVVLEGPPTVLSLNTPAEEGPIVLMACGLSSRSATAIGESLQHLLEAGSVDLHALSTVLGRRSRQMTWRSYAITGAAPSTPLSFSQPRHCSREKTPLVFIFSGQGPQHIDMGRELFVKFAAFRDSIIEMDGIFKRATGQSIIHDYGLFGGGASINPGETWPISLTLPSIAIFQIAFFDLMISLGIKPDVVLGHSAGETAVLYASGAGPKAMAVELAILRGKVFSSVEHLGGTMAAISCDPQEAQSMINDVLRECASSVLEIACYNSPSAVAVAGHQVAIQCMEKMAEDRGRFYRKIRTRVPIHSSMMEVCKKDYVTGLRDLFGRYPGHHIPQIATYSTLTGTKYDGPYDWEYFWMTTRNPVRFAEAIQSIAEISLTATIEISPHPVLSPYVSSIVGHENIVLASTRRARPGQSSSEHYDVLELCAQLTVAGNNSVNFTVLNGQSCHELNTPLPEYPFLRKAFPLYPETGGYFKQLEPHRGPLNHHYLKMNKDTHPILAEHVIRGEPIMPAAGFIEMALEFGATALVNVNMRAILSLSSEKPTRVNVTLSGSHWTVKSTVSMKSVDAVQTSMERLHADGYLTYESPPNCDPADIHAIRQRCQDYTGSSFYNMLEYFSDYGPRFRRVTNVYYGYCEALVSIRGMDETLESDGRYLLHPAILDACLHITGHKSFHGDFDPNGYFLPAHVNAVVLHRPSRVHYFPSHIYAHVLLKKWTPESVYFDIMVLDDHGQALCTLQMLEVTKHRINPPSDTAIPFQVILQAAIPSPTSVTEARKTTPPCPELVYEAAEGSDYHQLARRHVKALQNSLHQFSSANHKRVVRMLLSCDDDPSIELVKDVLLQHPHFFFEIFLVNDQSHNTHMQLGPHFGSVRILKIDSVLSVSEYTPTLLFDAIVILHLHTHAALGQDLVHLVQRLIPEGSLAYTQRLTPEARITEDEYKLQEDMQEAGMKVHHALFTAEGTTTYLSLWAQKTCPLLGSSVETPLFDPLDVFLFHYSYGHEADLQFDLSGLDTSAKLDIWIVTKEGRDGGAALGLVRALRHEYTTWNMRLIIFPTGYDEDACVEYLGSLPRSMQDELDIIVDVEGRALVPRMVPLSSDYCTKLLPARAQTSNAQSRPGGILTKVQAISRQTALTAIVGIEERTPEGDFGQTQFPVMGFVLGVPESHTYLTHPTFSYISPLISQYATVAVASIPGLVAAILAQGLHTLNMPERIKSLRILVTHSDTATGLSIQRIYASQNINVVAIPEGVNMLELVSMCLQPFDIILSGYQDPGCVQIMRTLLAGRGGRISLWADELESPAALLNTDPWAVKDALEAALAFLEDHVKQIEQDIHGLLDANADRGGTSHSPDTPIGETRTTFTCDPAKTYLVLGGIGSLGAHIAMLLYQRGARRIVLTSRRGAGSLHSHPNKIVRRMFEYLAGIGDLDIKLEAVDASCPSSMKRLIGTLQSSLGGCIVLTAVLHDRTFPHLAEEDFAHVFTSKLGVIQALLGSIDVSTLDFLIAFSSFVGLIGNGGQANYAAANTAMEQQLSSFNNAFSFICPGITDSSLMLAGRDPLLAKQFNHFTGWSITAEDMTLWLEDAISRFQQGERFVRYIPSLDWEVLHRDMGMPIIGKHLVLEQLRDEISDGSELDRMAAIVRSALGVPLSDFSADTPLTTYGIDSLSAARLSMLLRPIVEVSQLQLLADVSVTNLWDKHLRATASQTNVRVRHSATISKEEQMRRLLDKYSNGLEQLPVTQSVELTRDHIVVVTGTTGALGCNILFHLLGRDTVKLVYALNRRSPDGTPLLSRQRLAFRNQGLPQNLACSSKLVLVECDLRHQDLGIEQLLLHQIISHATRVIHNAWKVDFYSTLDSFEEMILGTRTLINLALRCKLAAHATFSFVSSIGTYRHHEGTGMAQEQAITDPKVSIDSGYTESKWVAERLTQLVAEKTSLRTSVIRTGLLSGGVNGSWNTNHWFPALAQSAQYVGCLPEGEDDISWIPINTAAASIVDISTGAAEGALHIKHPHPVLWSTVMEPLADIMGVPLVPYAEWFARLESVAADDPVQNEASKGHYRAAVKLIDFFHQGINPREHHSGATESMGLMPRVAMERGLCASATLQQPALQPLGRKDVECWVAYWRDIGFLPDA